MHAGDILDIQEKLLELQYSDQKPNDDFLQSFAGVVGNRWPTLASLLSLTLRDIQEIKTEREMSSRADHPLHMLRRWASNEEATYGQLCERLKTVSLFQC